MLCFNVYRYHRDNGVFAYDFVSSHESPEDGHNARLEIEEQTNEHDECYFTCEVEEVEEDS